MRHSAKRLKHHYERLSRWLILGLGVFLFGSAVAVYLYGDIEARYLWHQWQEPYLAIALARSDAPLLMEIGNYYYGTVIAGNAKPQYNPVLTERAFAKAVAIEPGILWGHYSLARIAFVRGDFNTALKEINAELAANPENLRALYIRGLIYGYRKLPGDLYLAERDFTRFTEWAPSEWAGWNDLAWILAKEGKYREMKAVAERAFTRVPEAEANPWLWNSLGVARLNLGDMSGAKVAFERALEYGSRLTLTDWRRAYSGNSPANDQSGLGAFIAGLEKNLAAVDYVIAR